ncbi:hypothetical protein SAMN05428987_4880 [Paenibacillus sp. CF095]|uniref:hypothetical protein n=1 Tax=Paenibacillus sp. CF095 TaxID=1881033 RepID=UPI0008803423|nr:hypothetical protein [Paenibacillus sp. CF095]SDD47414.1 hypothetical protein SAMN05428987_4880 [Paenibacillus sp. CF095]
MINKDLSYLRVGRGLGEFPADNKSKMFVVANGFQEFELSQFEYTVWEQIHRYETLAAWESAILQKVKNIPNFDFSKIVRRLIERNLIMPWSFSDMQDKNLINLQVTRYGYAHGLINEEYLIGDSNANKTFVFTKDQYDVWNAAAGKVMLLEVIDTLMDQRGINFETAISLFNIHGLKLYKLTLWGLEYVNADQLEVQA